MAERKIVQDIVSPNKRSIRNISVSKPKKHLPTTDDVDEPVILKKNKNFVPIKRIKLNKNKRKIAIIGFLIAIVCVGLIAMSLSLNYSKAVITITPKVVNFNVNGTFTAKKASVGDDFGYEVISITEEQKQVIPASTGPLVQSKARGVVTIFNNHSEKSQTLVAGTRLSDTNGLIYRTASTISIPGIKTGNPGKAEVNIVADQAGEKYNARVSDLKGDFKIVGYKGTDKYNTFYARLKSDISGGFSGNKMIIGEDVEASAVAVMKQSLNSKIQEKLKSSIPKKYILYDDAINIDYEILSPMMRQDNTAEITVRATGYGAIFEENSLLRFIAGKEIRKFPSDTYRIEGEDKLNFKISNSKDFSAKKGSALIFTLQGPISIVGTFSEEKLKQELAGIRLEKSNAVFAKYAAISNAYALITPFWKRSFPNTLDKISIEYKK